MTQFGIDVSTLNTTELLQHQYDARVVTYGTNGVRHTKIFGSAPGKTNSPITPLAGSNPVYCFKSWDEKAFMSFLSVAPKGSVFCYKQESENKLATPADLVDYHAVYARMAQLTSGSGFFLLKCGMHYTEDIQPSKYPYHWADMDGGQRFPNLFVGIDCYSSASLINQHNLLENPAQLFQSVVAWAHNSNLPVCVPEFGAVPVPNDADNSYREYWLLQCIEYARKMGFAWVNWWDTMGNTPADNYLLAGTHLQPVWRWAVTL